MDKIFEFLNEPFLEFGKHGSISPGKVLVIIAIFFGTRLILWSVSKLFDRIDQSRRMPMDQGRRKAIVQILRYVLYVLAVLIILGITGAEITGLVAGSAALLVGVGFGLQQTFNDIMSGIIILVDGTIEVGDVIEVDSVGLFGKVTEIKLRASLIVTPDSVYVIVPNSKITSSNVINWSHDNQETRFKVRVGVAYGSDVSLVRKVLKEVAQNHGRVLKQPEPKVFFDDFGDSALIFHLLFWTENHFEIEEIRSDIRFMIEAEFRRNHIRIPFPQRDIHVISTPGNLVTSKADKDSD